MANARNLRMIFQIDSKNDRLDAEQLGEGGADGLEAAVSDPAL